MATATVVVDVLKQAVFMGDLNHAIRAGTMTGEAVHAELGSLVTGKKPGRRNAEEITLFDSTGVGIQDVAAAAHAYEIARERGLGSFVQFLLKNACRPAFPSMQMSQKWTYQRSQIEKAVPEV
jgi:ornithine cyclodeaminase/alanine dehydrogenase-like protein (mu-crystallin family)